MRQPEVLYEDAYLLVLHKPAGMATQSANVRQEDLVSWTAKHRAAAGEDPYVGLLSRLDQPVEGIVVLAKDEKSAACLTRQIADRTFQKHYLAVTAPQNGENGEGKKAKTVAEAIDAGEWTTLEDYLAKDAAGNTSHVADQKDKRAKKAKLCYRDVTGDYTTAPAAGIRILDIRLSTGRHHQIRVQLAHAGMPIAGDTKYGSGDACQKDRYPQLGLFAYHVHFSHPKEGKMMEFDIPLPLAMYGIRPKTVIE